MSDDHQSNTDAPKTTIASETPAKGGGSGLKLIGIALGLTLIAALVVGGVFWKTLNDSVPGEAFYIPQDDAAAIDAVGDSSAPAADSGEQVAGEDAPEFESSDESPEASAEPEAKEETGTASKSEASVSE